MKLNRKIIYYLLTFLILLSLIYSLLVLFDRYLFLKSVKGRMDFIIKEQIIKKQSNKIRNDLLLKGYKSIYPPSLFHEKKYLKIIDRRYPPFSSQIKSNLVYCNEGEGLIYFKSDRFGFRNDDKIWDFKDTKHKTLLIGDSFGIGACVKDKHVLLKDYPEIDLFNVSTSGNDPEIYSILSNIFIEYIKPKTTILLFTTNDRLRTSKNFRIYLEDDQIVKSLIQEGKYPELYEYNLKKSYKYFNEISNNAENIFFSYYKKLTRHLKLSTLLTILNSSIKYNLPSSSKLAIDISKQKCEKFKCDLIVAYIPTSQLWRPDTFEKKYEESLMKYSMKLGLKFISLKENINEKTHDKLYATHGPHLSSYGYSILSKKIFDLLKFEN